MKDELDIAGLDALDTSALGTVNGGILGPPPPPPPPWLRSYLEAMRRRFLAERERRTPPRIPIRGAY